MEQKNMIEIENYEMQMVAGMTLEERCVAAMALRGYSRVDLHDEKISFKRTGDENQVGDTQGWIFQYDSWEAVKESMRDTPLWENADITQQITEMLDLTENTFLYYTQNLGGSGAGSDQQPVTYQNLTNALEAYLQSEADGKEIGYMIRGEKHQLCHFDVVDMRNHITSLFHLLHNGTMNENERNQVESTFSYIKPILDKNNVYYALQEGVGYIENKCIQEVGHGNTEWGSWMGRVANTHRPQDYLEIDIMGFEKLHQIQYTLSVVHENEIVQTMEYTIHTDPGKLVESIANGRKNIAEEIDEFLYMAVEKLNTDVIYPMQLYSPHTSSEITDHYTKLVSAGYDLLPKKQEDGSSIIAPDRIKDFVKKYYEYDTTLKCTEKIAEVLAVSIQKMIDSDQMDSTKASIESVLCKESTLRFITSRQPNVSPVSTEVVKEVTTYFEQSSGLLNYVPIKVCRISNDPEDAHLYAVVGYNSKSGQYACWTSWNQNQQSLNYGHYNLADEQTAIDIIKERFNDISGDTDRYGVENTLTKLLEDDKKDVKKAETDIVLKFNGRKGR